MINAKFQTIIIPAHAKINLTLELLGRRDDGYTEISSIMTPLKLHDLIELSPAKKDELEVIAEGTPIDQIGSAQDNLCMRATRIFRKNVGLPFGVKIKIYKRIPVGGGLGGGSADCAATLRGLNELFPQHALSEETLKGIAVALGSDIPSLLHGGATHMTGRGENVTPIVGKIPKYDVVLVNPGIHVSARTAYRAIRDGIARRPEGTPSLNSILTSAEFSSNIDYSSNCGGGLSTFATCLFNGLESTVFERVPAVAHVAQLLKDAGAAGVLMSGSGATVFALAASHDEAIRIKQAMPAEFWTATTKMMPDGVMAAHGPLEA